MFVGFVLITLLASACQQTSIPTPVLCTTLRPSDEPDSPAFWPRDMAFDQQGNLWVVGGNGLLGVEGALRLSEPANGMCTHFAAKNNLKGAWIAAVSVDNKGNVWFGDWLNGDVFRFDGNRWRTYTKYDGSDDEGNTVFDIAVAPNGDIWLAVPYYAYRYDGQDWSTYTAEDGLPDPGISAVAAAQDGDIWFGGYNSNIVITRFDGFNWTPYYVEDGLADNAITDIAVTQDGVVWVGTRHGVSRLEDNRWITYGEEDGLRDDSVADIEVDQKGDVWFATAEGVTRFDGQTWVVYTEKDGLLNRNIMALAVDHDGIIWAGTEGGVSRFNGGGWISYLVGDQVESE